MEIQKHYAKFKESAKLRRHDFELSLQQFWDLAVCACFYCGEAPELQLLRYSGVDRVDSKKGYVIGNCVACCGRCNMLKGRLSIDDFRSQIQRIYTHWGHKNGDAETERVKRQSQRSPSRDNDFTARVERLFEKKYAEIERAERKQKKANRAKPVPRVPKKP